MYRNLNLFFNSCIKTCKKF